MKFLSYNKIILLLLLLGYFILYFGFVGISVLTPEIISDQTININKNDIGMIIFVSGLIRLPEKLFSGFLADMISQKWLYILAGLAKHIFVVLFAVSSDFWLLILFWSLQEFVWGPIWPCNIKIMNNWFDKYSIATAMGILNLSYLFGDGLMRLAIGLMLYYQIYWRTIMLICPLIGIGYLIILIVFLKNHPDDTFIWQYCFKKRDEDNLLSSEDDQLLSGDDQLLNSNPTKNTKTLVSIWNKHWKPLLGNPSFWLLFVTVATISFARYTLFYWTPLYLIYVGSSQSMAAIGSLAFPLAGGIGAVIIGLIDDRMNTDFKKHLVMFVFFIGATISIFFLWLIQDQSWQNLILTLILYSLIGFFLLSAYTLPSGVMALRFGSDCAGHAASLLEFAGGIAMALSGLMSRIISDNNNWTLIWFICLLSSIVSFISLFFFVKITKNRQSTDFESNTEQLPH